MGGLTDGPAGALRSAEDAVALARAMARGAALAYRRCAEATRQRGRVDVAGILDELAEAERARDEALAAGAPREGDAASRSLATPETPAPFSPDDAEAFERSSLLTPYKVWAAAVRAAERAFAFWSYQAAQARGEAARAAAEEMARRALDQAAALRRSRRAAFHAQRGSLSRVPAQALERLLAQRLRAAPGLLRPDAAEALARLSDELAEFLGATKVGVDAPAEASPPSLAEALLDGYLAAAAATRDEAAQTLLHEAARRAVGRLAALREEPASDPAVFARST